MDCHDVKGLFLAYHDGELSAQSVTSIEEHLATCQSCSGEWEAYRAAVSEISGLTNLDLEEDFHRSVEQSIKKRSRGRFFNEAHSYSVRFAAVSFLLILAFLLVYLVVVGVDYQVIGDSDQSTQGAQTGTLD